MNPLLAEWFRKVDIFPNIVTAAGNDHCGIPWAKRFWKTAYRDARQRARIFDHSCAELRNFRGFGILKQIWAKSGNCIGRVRIDDLRNMDNDSIATRLKVQDYNPNRQFEEIR